MILTSGQTYRWNDSNKWSNIGLGDEIKIIEIKKVLLILSPSFIVHVMMMQVPGTYDGHFSMLWLYTGLSYDCCDNDMWMRLGDCGYSHWHQGTVIQPLWPDKQRYGEIKYKKNPKTFILYYRAPDKVRIFISKMPISSPNPMFDHLLESSQSDDSNKWSNIRFGEEITQSWLELMLHILSGTFVNTGGRLLFSFNKSGFIHESSHLHEPSIERLFLFKL